MKTAVRKMPNWKATGLDFVLGFWFKKPNGLHTRLKSQLQDCLNQGTVPEWMVRGRTVLVMKDPKKGTVVTNYRPIACLPMMWKLLTGMIAEEIYVHLAQNGLLVDEQKGCRKVSRGTKDQLLIDKEILKNCRRRLTNLSMAWILKCMDMVGVAGNVVTIIRNSMAKWKTVLTSGGKELGEVNIKRGIFQGDSLFPLLFVIMMLPLTLMLRYLG